MPGLRVAGYRMTAGQELVRRFEAPILYGPPAYVNFFCTSCGSPVPDPNPDTDTLELPAGLLDDDPGLRPDKHIFTECLPAWDVISDDLPQMDIFSLNESRTGKALPADFQFRSHYDGIQSDE